MQHIIIGRFWSNRWVTFKNTWADWRFVLLYSLKGSCYSSSFFSNFIYTGGPAGGIGGFIISPTGSVAYSGFSAGASSVVFIALGLSSAITQETTFLHVPHHAVLIFHPLHIDASADGFCLQPLIVFIGFIFPDLYHVRPQLVANHQELCNSQQGYCQPKYGLQHLGDMHKLVERCCHVGEYYEKYCHLVAAHFRCLLLEIIYSTSWRRVLM